MDLMLNHLRLQRPCGSLFRSWQHDRVVSLFGPCLRQGHANGQEPFTRRQPRTPFIGHERRSEDDGDTAVQANLIHHNLGEAWTFAAGGALQLSPTDGV